MSFTKDGNKTEHIQTLINIFTYIVPLCQYMCVCFKNNDTYMALEESDVNGGSLLTTSTTTNDRSLATVTEQYSL